MQELNDDCLIHILVYLDLKDHLRLIHMHSRFRRLMPFVWRQVFRRLDLCLLLFSDFTVEDFNFLMESIARSVQSINLKSISRDKFDALVAHTYPNVHDFRFSQRQPLYLTDEAIMKIVNSFPSIRTFSPHGRFSGEHFTSFAHLENLTLGYCSHFLVENFAKILQRYQLKSLKLDLFERRQVETYIIPVEHLSSLQYLKIYSEELEWFDQYFGRLLNLKEIIVTCVEQFTLQHLCNKLHSAGRDNIYALESCNSDDAVAIIFNSNITATKISIVTDSKLLLNTEMIQFQNFQSLRELYFNVCTIGEEANLTHLLYNIPQVEILSLEECDCHFTDYFILAERVVEERIRKIKLNFWHNVTNLNGRSYSVRWHLCGNNDLLEFITDGILNPISFEPIRIIFK